jgi:hypothetical protein
LESVALARILCRRTAVSGAVLLFTVCAVSAQSPQSAGRVKIVKGDAVIVRAGQSRPAAVGDEVFKSDVLRTGAGSHLGVTLRDETRLALGPGSEVSLTAFEFAPTASRYDMVLRVVRGAMSYISGRIAKLAPERVRLETPSLVIGVRGTHALIKVEEP